MNNFVIEGIEAAQILKNKRETILNTTGKTIHDDEDLGSDDKILMF